MTQREPLDPSYYARAFASPEANRVLEELTRLFGPRAAKTAGGIDAVLETYERAGAARVISFIHRRIDAANNGDPHGSEQPE